MHGLLLGTLMIRLQHCFHKLTSKQRVIEVLSLTNASVFLRYYLTHTLTSHLHVFVGNIIHIKVPIDWNAVFFQCCIDEAAEWFYRRELSFWRSLISNCLLFKANFSLFSTVSIRSKCHTSGLKIPVYIRVEFDVWIRPLESHVSAKPVTCDWDVSKHWRGVCVILWNRI